jgi:LacI family transcriptional regulator
MTPRKVTAAAVARLADVSKWTVIRAFDPEGSISDETRLKVRKAADKLGYRPNLLARSLATNRTNQVAVLIDDFTNLHKLPLLAKLSMALQSKGKVLMLININRDFEQNDALIHAYQRQVDGVILFANSLQDTILEQARVGKVNTPLLILARETTLDSVPSITTDTATSIAEICSYLWKHGYRQPGFMTGPVAQASLVSRLAHFREEWHLRGVANVPVLAAGSYHRQDGEAAMRRYLETSQPGLRIDVLMCENDNLALGAMDVARAEFGLKVPQDLAFVGYDDIDMASAPSYALTTYEQPLNAMVAASIEMLSERGKRRSVKLQGRLVIRSSA